MDQQHQRERETQELIKRFKEKRARRRRLRLALAGVAVLVVIGGGLAAVALAGGPTGGTGLVDVSSATAPTASNVTTAASQAPSQGASTTTGNTATRRRTTTTLPTTTTRRTTTTVKPTTTSTTKTNTTASPASSGKVVVIDPGHQAHGDSSLEPVGPGSSEKKAKVSSGTAGVVTGIPESELVLAVGLKLRDSLKAHGIKVVMTRTSQDVNISNIARAQIANEANADLFVRVHADGTDNSSTTGIHVLYPATIEGWTDDIAVASKKAASLAQQALVAATGAKDRGIDARSDMTGFNWSDVPAIIPEIGFMTNATEDRLLATAEYQDKIVKGLTKAILEFLGLAS